MTDADRSAADYTHPTLRASSTTPNPLRCNLCTAKFTGSYRVGNLARHNRQKHRAGVVSFPCEDEDCGRVFARKDARLKHYRKHHEKLGSSPAASRTNYSQRRGSGVASQQLGSPCGGESQYSDYWQHRASESQDGFQLSDPFGHPFEQPGLRDQDLFDLTDGGFKSDHHS
jgi:hypothetical protein